MRCAPFERAIATAQAAGGQLLVGGKTLTRPGHFVEPAIVLAGNDLDIVQHETFGPILYLIAVDSIDEAIRLQNESAYGLSSGLFTQRLQHAEQYLSHQGSDCGIANVNIGTFRRRDRRRLRRREGYRRRPRSRLRCLEDLHAPPDQYRQLELGAAAGAGHRVRHRAVNLTRVRGVTPLEAST